MTWWMDKIIFFSRRFPPKLDSLFWPCFLAIKLRNWGRFPFLYVGVTLNILLMNTWTPEISKRIMPVVSHKHTHTHKHKTPTNKYTPTHNRTNTQTHTQTHKHTDTQTHRHTNTQNMQACKHPPTHTPTPPPTHTHTHKHKHKHNLGDPFGSLKMCSVVLCVKNSYSARSTVASRSASPSAPSSARQPLCANAACQSVPQVSAR